MLSNKNDFECLNCGKGVVCRAHIGTSHRNHCPFCLWSKHVDEYKTGDRKSTCHGAMEPVGLTFKKEKPDKYRKDKGELMIVHRCTLCGKISINRIAGDDDPKIVLSLLEIENINTLSIADLEDVKNALFGKK